ncbi:uncharacterized protein ASPGLDRAFT_56508 [Aspergillus glaucus CBS 516.65]|uniref:PNPLA domain-containing protein n=1 Tax=Aspergillus glaucus CBS 516.65 TaxID=1160497 RepID=A0A1L9VPV6_ASPGL|nr:hypothetical protein ASPGLDRAFT_56508 [Aspergillus glaucus CBS 516.65]OJJ85945.1 hypothetical protein ASPGLDRAFT_56508 [Aspergillus glaucus CBS 516.65]
MPWVSLGAFRADYYDYGRTHPLCVLAMDGGGVRGLSSFIPWKIFDKLEERLGERKKPCKIFNIIGGTSTGGLIAIMLGRLQMDVKDCITKYQKLIDIVFKKRSGTLGSIMDWITKKASFIWSGQIYDDEPLETETKKLVKSQLGNENAKLLEGEGNPGCKLFVVATRRDALNNHGPVFLRSYKHPHDSRGLSNVKLWQAARATSAGPAYFSSVKVGDYELVDGGYGQKYLASMAWAVEANCFLSIGTGIGSNQALTDPRKAPGQAISAITAAATNSGIAHLLFRTLIDAFAPNSGKPKYWRLNVNKPIRKVIYIEFSEIKKSIN